MNFVIISGSSRAGAQSLKVAKWFESKLNNLEHQVSILDLHEVNLPLSHEEIWSEIDNDETAKSVRDQLDKADGFIIVTPEWNGMAGPALKNLFHYVKMTMAYKPTYLVAVSGYRGGAYPIAELRMNSAKNTYINYIPEHLIVRGADKLMNDLDENSGDEADQYVKKRGLYGLGILIEYSKALKLVRDSNVLDFDTYQNGM
jgi:NAD(P)H-dependent FMN reductase